MQKSLQSQQVALYTILAIYKKRKISCDEWLKNHSKVNAEFRYYLLFIMAVWCLQQEKIILFWFVSKVYCSEMKCYIQVTEERKTNKNTKQKEKKDQPNSNSVNNSFIKPDVIAGFHCHTIIKTIKQIKSRIKEIKKR